MSRAKTPPARKSKVSKAKPKSEADIPRATEIAEEKKIRRMGRPSEFTSQLGDRICEEIMSGSSLRTICLPDSMPNIVTVIRWLAKPDDDRYSEFCKQYARAREVQADVFFEDALQIAHDGRNDYIEIEDESGKIIRKVDFDHINRSRLRVDTLKWAIGKMAPKKYSDRTALELSGPDGGQLPVQIVLPSNGRDIPNPQGKGS